MSASLSGTRWYPSLRSANSPMALIAASITGAIAAQDPQRVEICLELDVLAAAASRVEDLHAHDWRDPHPIVVSRHPDERRQIPAERREPPPRRGVYDERRVVAQQLDGIHCWLGVFAGQPLDVLERAAIQPIRAEDTLHAPTVEEIVAVMRQAGDNRHNWRLRALIVVLWRGGVPIQEALALSEPDLDPRRGSLLVCSGKGGRRREIGMDVWGWEQLRPWLTARLDLPVGALFCIIDGPTSGRSWSSAGVRVELRRLAAQAGVRRRFAPHQLRHAHAVELAREASR
jgi:hypothetical protein